MFVCEIFRSLQGECLVQGAPTVFVRFGGCNLKCSWCDTSYAQDHSESEEMSVSAVMDRVQKLDPEPRYVCLTGGEPLLQPRSELDELLHSIGRMSLHTSTVVETNGSQPVDWLIDSRRRLLLDRGGLSLAVDCKLGSSGVSRSMIQSNYRRLDPRDALKFVCGNMDDAQEATGMLRALARVHTCLPVVYFHSVGGGVTPQLADFILHSLSVELGDRFDIRLGVQLHKLLWGNERGK